MNELGQILDQVNIVMGRGRNELHTRLRVAQASDQRVHLVARKLATFAGFGSLRHFDFQLAGIHEVIGREPEAARRHLLGVRAGEIAVGIRLVADRIFTAFPEI